MKPQITDDLLPNNTEKCKQTVERDVQCYSVDALHGAPS